MSDMDDDVDFEVRVYHDMNGVALFAGNATIERLRCLADASPAEGLERGGVQFLQDVLADGDPDQVVPVTALLGAAAAMESIAGIDGPVSAAMLRESAATLVTLADRATAQTLLAAIRGNEDDDD